MAKKYINPLLDVIQAEFDLMLTGSYKTWKPEDQPTDVKIVDDPPEDEEVNAKGDTWGNLWEDSIGWDD